MNPCQISCLELACIRYPKGLVTSGTGQAYLSRLDKIFPKRMGFWARTGAGGYLVLNADESEQFNLTEAEFFRVVKP